MPVPYNTIINLLNNDPNNDLNKARLQFESKFEVFLNKYRKYSNYNSALPVYKPPQN
jgi:hypothetical protein